MNALKPVFLPFFCAVLLAVYMELNWHKVGVMLAGFDLYGSASALQTLTLKQGDVKVLKYDLPTSDMFDRSGQRQLNFRYVSNERFSKLQKILSKPLFFINDQPVKEGRIERFPKSLAIVLPEKKVYLLAPPHAEQFVRVLQYERSQRPDVMACTGAADFCQTVKLAALGAVSGLKDRVLKEDTMTGFVVPMGRWVSDELDVKILSKRVQEVIITGRMMVPFNEQSIAIKDPQGARYRIVDNDIEFLENSGSLVPFVFKIKLPLNRGETILRVLFAKVTENHQGILIPKFSGVLTHLEISPVL